MTNRYGMVLINGQLSEMSNTDTILGNISGSAATVTNATQSAITALGTLTSLVVKAGTGSATSSIGGRLNANFTVVANSGTGETDLQTYSLPANTLVTTGQVLAFYFQGVFINSANAKTLKVYFGATACITISLPTATVGSYYGTLYITRTGSNAQSYAFNFTRTVTGGGTVVTCSPPGTTNETEAGAITLKVTGQGGASNEINENLSIITNIP